MSSVKNHMSSEDLLRFADGELSLVEAARAKHHLAECWDCRAKMQQAENTICETMDLHHQILDSQLPPVAGSRALLKARLQEMERLGERHSAVGIPTWSQVAFGGALFAVAVAGLWIGQYWMKSKLQAPRLFAFTSYAEPDPRLTPGAARLVSADELCSTELSDDTSAVPADTKEKVLKEYGVAVQDSARFQLDYLISPQLGGTEDISNLWPEPSASTVWNLKAKDALEERLHRLVCRGNISLATAQRDLATDWISAYKKYFNSTQPVDPL
jgi:hypothetical protein